MTEKPTKILEMLIEKGTTILREPYHDEKFSENDKANELLLDIKCYPHAFVLACVMDRQMKAERVWEIPYKVAQEIGGFEFDKLSKLSAKEYKQVFSKKDANSGLGYHRFPDMMAECFYEAVKLIDNEYNGDASKIWIGNPSSGDVVIRFLRFKGVGVKIATMAANILARSFKVPMTDHRCIDISPDRQVMRVFERIGLIVKGAGVDELVYRAREIYPEYPGVFDYTCWEIGRNWCRPDNPACSECYLDKLCPKIP
jgi:Predicted EndoIII-related endonuclease